MKRTILFSAAVFALAMLSSCQKPQTPSQTEGVTEFTATIDNTAKRDTKTSITIEGNVGKIEWCQGDEITVTDGAGAKAIYVAQSSGARTMFLIKAGETPLGAGPYKAAYGDIAKQTYSAVGANCPLFVASATTEFQFKCELAILKITASSTVAKTVKSVEVSGGTSVTLDCGAGVALSSGAKDFYIAINPGAYTQLKVTFTATDNTVAEMSRTSGINLAANDLLPATFSLENWKALPPEGALSGKFSVSATQQVYFSKGNLQAKYNGSPNSYTFGFADNQYDFIGDDETIGGNVSIDYDENNPPYYYTQGSNVNGAVVDLFGWSTPIGSGIGTYVYYGISSSEDVLNYYGYFKDWGTAIDDKGTWRTPSGGVDANSEWYYLLFNRTVNGGTGEGHSYSNLSDGVMIDDYPFYGLFIYPDDYTGSAIGAGGPDTWAEINAKGIAFLPMAGLRYGDEVHYMDGYYTYYGVYWSSTMCDVDDPDCYCLEFSSPSVDYDVWMEYNSREFGYSVRLVSDVK